MWNGFGKDETCKGGMWEGADRDLRFGSPTNPVCLSCAGTTDKTNKLNTSQCCVTVQYGGSKDKEGSRT
eukprot:1142029-Pelagomonas_calceolata.AAC.1